MKKLSHLLLAFMLTGLAFHSCDKEETNLPQACFVASQERIAGMPIDFSTSCTLFANSYRWDFGDGQSSTEAYPSHTYNKSGDYAVTLTVTNSNGDSDDVTHIMVVEDPV